MNIKVCCWAAGALSAAAMTMACAADPLATATGEVREEVARQREIYLSRGDAVPSGYTIDRSLLTYTQSLASGFRQTLAKLGNDDRWLDIGAGEGRAAIDYITSRYEAYFAGFEPRPRADERARVVALSIEDRRTHRWHEALRNLSPGRIEYLHGRSFSEYRREELGQFQLITDVMGGFSYTPRLSVFLTKTLATLAIDGSFYGVLADVRAERTDNPPHYAGATHLTRIVAGDGRDVRICSYLKRIGCVEVTCEFKPDWTPPIETYRVRKICPNVTVPALALEHFESGTPPERRFRLVDDLPAGRTASGR